MLFSDCFAPPDKQEFFIVQSTYVVTYDVVVVLHNSVAVDTELFQKMKMTIKQLLNNFLHPDIDARLSVGVLTFSDRPRIVRRLRIAETADSVSPDIDDIEQTGRGCALESALEVVRGMFGWFTDNKLSRPNLVVVLMGGQPDQHTETVATAEGLTEDGLPLVVLGFGSLTRASISGIATNDNVLFVHDSNNTGKDVADEVYDAIKKGKLFITRLIETDQNI